MNNKNLQKEAEETEFLTADQRKISELVASLERVYAPNDFEFRLKARIAAGKEESHQAGYPQWLRYLLPVGALAFVLAFVLYGTNFFAPSQPDEQATDTKPIKSEEIVTKPVEIPSNTIVVAANSNKAEDLPVNPSNQKDSLPNVDRKQPILIADKSNSKKVKSQSKVTSEDKFKGVKDIGLKETNVQILPKGLNPDKKLKNPQEFEKSQAFTAEEILNNIGIETVSENNKLKVKSIRQNSPAGLSDVKDGDIIEAIDKQKINGNSKSRNLRGAKKLTVLRDGKSITIDLKSN